MLLAVLVLAASLSPPFLQEPEAPRPRSVVFYLVDTCRADRLSVYGNERKTTPFLESIAARGVVFEHCSSQASWTKPSMASMLCSRYPSETGVYKMFQRLDSSFLTLPEALQQSGWRTVGFSANPIMGAWSNYAQGFDRFVESATINKADPIHYASGSAKVLNDGWVLPWLREQPDWPVFLYVHSVDPHEEYAPAQEYLELYSDASAVEVYRDEWELLLQTRPAVPGNHLTPWNFEFAGLDPGPFIEQGMKLYDADLRANDYEIERLYEELQAQGWGEDLVLVITSDHGEEFFEHEGTSHGYGLYEELTHVPLILFAPGLLPEGLRIRTPVRSLDIYPTLLDLLGQEIPKGLSGRSLLPLIADPATASAEPVYSELAEDPDGRSSGSPNGVAISLLEGRWKFILNLRSPYHRERPRHELYDLIADPGETVNLAAQDPERVQALEERVMRWQAANLGVGSTAAAVAPDSLDAETLEILGELGYATSEEEAGVDPGEQVPVLVRAVLEGAKSWEILALDPVRPEGESTPLQESRRFLGFTVLGESVLKHGRRQELQEQLYRGIVESDGSVVRGFRPRHGVRAELLGHVVELAICYECKVMKVHLDGSFAASIPTSARVEKRVSALYRGAGLELAR